MNRVTVLSNALQKLKDRTSLGDSLHFQCIFDGIENYQYLTQRNSEKHLIIMDNSLRLVEYSSDQREYLYYEEDFNSLDDLIFFRNSYIFYMAAKSTAKTLYYRKYKKIPSGLEQIKFMMSTEILADKYYNKELKKNECIKRLEVTQVIDSLKINQSLHLQPQPTFDRYQRINMVFTALLLIILVFIIAGHFLLGPNKLVLISALLVTYGLIFTSILKIAAIMDRHSFNKATQADIPLLSFSQKLSIVSLFALIAFTVAIFFSAKTSAFFMLTKYSCLGLFFINIYLANTEEDSVP